MSAFRRWILWGLVVVLLLECAILLQIGAYHSLEIAHQAMKPWLAAWPQWNGVTVSRIECGLLTSRVGATNMRLALFRLLKNSQRLEQTAQFRHVLYEQVESRGCGSWVKVPTSHSPSHGAADDQQRCKRAVAETPHIAFNVQLYEPYIQEASLLYAVSPRLIRAIVKAESAGDPDAISPKGARGLMQLMPSTGAELGASVEDLHDPRTNIILGTRYFMNLLQETGDITTALAAYNFGPRRVLAGEQWPAETRSYVRRVKALL